MITTVTVNAAIDKSYHLKQLELGQVNRVADVIAVPGGKGINVSKVAHALGTPVVASGFLGGTNGRFIQQGLAEMGVRNEFVWVEGNSRETIAIWDEAGGMETELLEPGPAIEEYAQQQLVEKIAGLAKTSSVVTFSGSLPKGIPADFYARLIQVAKREGAITILDSSNEALVKGLESIPDICKPNRDEIEQLIGHRPHDQKEFRLAAEKLLDKGIQVVIVSMDQEGAIAMTADAAWLIIPPHVQVKSTVGCGDSMVAGIAHILDRYKGSLGAEELKEALRLGTAAAASNAMHREVGFIEPEEVKDLLEKVTIRRL
ncbi:1-phosphofructokinase [Brevibacillus choshinensis]|uniref:1-phosphofructokinase n=1 Tax=Brevibacillus choshinensis TaxID=54911 RepID=UPI002E20B6D0|nr:1-phosphofructokinase [Brevibacillus choshinensis]MED4784454.1 1-phosphofructokinase [Brevibacillus choshinensis]